MAINDPAAELEDVLHVERVPVLLFLQVLEVNDGQVLRRAVQCRIDVPRHCQVDDLNAPGRSEERGVVPGQQMIGSSIPAAAAIRGSVWLRGTIGETCLTPGEFSVVGAGLER